MMRHRIYCIYRMMLLAVVCLPCLVACDDDEVQPVEESAQTAEYRERSFRLPLYWEDIDEIERDITIRLIAAEGVAQYDFAARAVRSNGEMLITVRLGNGESIADGKYLMQGFMGGNNLGRHILACFRNETLYSEVQMYDYSFDASQFDRVVDVEADTVNIGTYYINSDDGFEWFLYCLTQDTNHAIGQTFIVNKAISLPMQGENNAGRGYSPQQFAGTFDGNNKVLSPLYHIGGSTPDAGYDSGIGLFSRLLNGATVRNVVLENISMNNVYSNVGGIAGAVSGTVTVDNVTVTGNINSITGYGHNVGGIIGNVESGSTLTVNDIDINMSVTNCGDNVGGVIGCVTSSSVTVGTVTTKEQIFNVSGATSVGGVIGYFNGTSFNISDVKLEHNVSNEDSDVAVIGSTGNSLGGIIGCAIGISADSRISNVDIKCPVSISDISSGTMDIGGVIGKLTVSSGTLTLDDCQVYGLVTGTANVGGLVGGYTGSGILKIQSCGIGSSSSSAAVGVAGNGCVGGLVGATSNGTIQFGGTTTMSANVLANDSTTTTKVGGLVGSLNATTMTIKGSGYSAGIGANVRVNGYSEVGGLVGKMSNGAYLYSSNSFDFNGSIPASSGFSSDFAARVTGTNNVGGAVGLVENSTVAHVNVTGTVIGYGNNVGGAFGKVDFSGGIRVEDITVSGEGSTIGKGDNTGGIAGYIVDEGRLQDCVNYRSVTGEGNNTGGIAGVMDYSGVNPYIRYCVNVGDVSGSGCFGGVAGRMKGGDDSSDWAKVEYCANYGKITGSGTDYDSHGAGGIVGFCGDKQVRVAGCANHGAVEVEGTFHGVGGIAGALGNDPTGVYELDNLDVYYCANFGAISCSGKTAHLGGILGWQEEGEAGSGDTNSQIHDCYNKGTIGDSQSDDNGGILGYADHYASIRRCVNMGETGSGNAIIGTKKTAAILHTEDLYYESGTGGSWMATDSFSSDEKGKEETFSGFDFDSVWKIENGEPRLRNCPFQSVSKP